MHLDRGPGGTVWLVRDNDEAVRLADLPEAERAELLDELVHEAKGEEASGILCGLFEAVRCSALEAARGGFDQHRSSTTMTVEVGDPRLCLELPLEPIVVDTELPDDFLVEFDVAE